MVNRRVLTSVVAALATTIAMHSFAQDRGTAGAKAGAPQGAGDVLRAHFNDKGEVLVPLGYRQWVHVGTRDNATGKINILDGKPIQTPEVLDAYVEPRAFAVYQRTGKWPDGAQLVKEFSSVRTGAGCQDNTFVCTTEFGDGIFQIGYVGLGMMVKDEKRFPGTIPACSLAVKAGPEIGEIRPDPRSIRSPAQKRPSAPDM